MFIRIAFLFLCMLIQVGAQAQCAFNPEIIPSGLTLCPFQSDTLFTGTADSYQWFRNGNPVNNSNQPFLVVSNPADNGATFQVVQTINGCSEASPTVTVTGISLPTFLIGVEGGGATSACIGDTLSLVINSGQSAGIQWFRNGAQLAGQSGTTLNVVQTGNYSATGAIAACPTSTQFSNTLSISFVPSSQPLIFEDVPAQTLNTNLQTGPYQWYLNGSPIEGATNASISPTDTGLYTVEVQFSAGCSRFSEPFQFEGFEVICLHTPTISPGSLVLCPGGTDTLFTEVYDSYQWFVNGIAAEGANTNFLVVDDTLAGSEITVAATLDGCTAISEIMIPLIHVFSPPDIVSPSDPAVVCEGNSITLSVSTGYTFPYSWSLNGNLIAGETSAQIEVIGAGVYTVSAATAVCPNVVLASAGVPVTVNPNPVPTLQLQGSSIVCNATAASYSWSLNGEVVPGLNSSTILAQIGTWQVTVTYSNGCTNVSLPVIVETIGFESIGDGMILLGPNPCEERIHLKARRGQLRVYSAEGRLVFQEQIPDGVLSLDTSTWLQGLYLFRWEGQSEFGSCLVLKR